MCPKADIHNFHILIQFGISLKLYVGLSMIKSIDNFVLQKSLILAFNNKYTNIVTPPAFVNSQH